MVLSPRGGTLGSVTLSAEEPFSVLREGSGGGDQWVGDGQPELRRQSSRGKQRPRKIDGAIPWSTSSQNEATPAPEERLWNGGSTNGMSVEERQARLREAEAAMQERHGMQQRGNEQGGDLAAELAAVRMEADRAKERAKYAMTELAKLRKAAREEAAELRARLEDTERLREEAAAARAEVARMTEVHAAELAETLAEANRAHKLAQVESVQRLKEAQADLTKLKSHMVTALGKADDEPWVWEGEEGGEVDTTAVVERLLEEVRLREGDATLAREMVERAEEEMRATSAALRAEVARSEDWKKEITRLKARVAEVEEERERVVREAWAKAREGTSASAEAESLRARLSEMEEERERALAAARAEVTREYGIKVAEARADVAREYSLKVAEVRAEVTREYSTAVAEARAEVAKEYSMAVAEARAEVESDYGMRLAQMESDLLRAEREARESEGLRERVVELEAMEKEFAAKVVELEGAKMRLESQKKEMELHGVKEDVEGGKEKLIEEKEKAVAEARDMAIARAEAEAEVTALRAEVADMRLAQQEQIAKARMVQQEQIARARTESQEAMRRVMEEHGAEVEALRAELEAKMSKLEGRVREAEAEELETRERLRAREDEFAAEMASLKSSMLEVGKIGGSRREVELLEGQVRALQAEVDAAKARGWTDGEKVIEELREELRDVSRELDESRLARAMEVERLQSRVREKEEELLKLAEVTERAQEERKAELAQLRSEMERVGGAGGGGDVYEVRRLEAAVQEKEKELQTAWEAFEELRRENAAEKERAQVEAEAVKAEVQKLRARLEGGGVAARDLDDDEREKLVVECAAAKAEIEKLRVKLKRSTMDAMEAARDLQKEIRDEYEERLKILSDEAQVAQAEADKVRAEIRATEESLLAVKASQVEMKERYELEISNLRKSSLSKTSSYVVWPQDEVQQEHEEEVMALRAQVEDAHERASAASSQAETLRMQLASMEGAVQAAEASYKEELSVLHKELDMLRSQSNGKSAANLRQLLSANGDLDPSSLEGELREEFVHELEEAMKREEATRDRAEKAEARAQELQAQAQAMEHALLLVEEDQKKLREEFVSELEESCIREHKAEAEAESLRTQLRELQEGGKPQQADVATSGSDPTAEKLKTQLLDVQGSLQAALYAQSKLKEDFAKQTAKLTADLQAEQAKTLFEHTDAERLRTRLNDCQAQLQELQQRQEEAGKEHSLALAKLQSAADAAAEEAASAKATAEQRLSELKSTWERLQVAELELGWGSGAIQAVNGNKEIVPATLGAPDWASKDGMMLVSLESSTKLEVVQKEANELAIQLSEMTKEVERLRVVEADLEKQLQMEESEVVWLQRKLRDHEFALQASTEGGARSGEARMELPHLAEDTEAHLGALMARRHEVGDRIHEYSVTRLAASEQALEAARAEIAALRSRLAEAEARALDRARTMGDSNGIDPLDKKLGPTKSYRERARETENLRRSHAALQIELTAAHEELHAMRARLSQLSDSESLRQRVVEAEEEVEWLQEQLQSAKDNAALMGGSSGQLMRLGSGESVLSQAGYENALVAARAEVSLEVEALRSQLHYTETALKAASNIHSGDGADAIRRHMGEVVSAASDAAELRWRLQQAERDAETVRQRSTEAIDGYLAEIERLRSELAQSSKGGNSRLERKLKEVREEAAASQEEARRARAEVESLRNKLKDSTGIMESTSEFSSRLGASDDELVKLRVRLQEAEGSLYSTQKARARLEETLAGATAEVQSLRSHLDANGASAFSGDSGQRELLIRIDDLQRRATRAEADAAELRVKLRNNEAAEQECEWLKQKLREVTADYTAVQVEIARQTKRPSLLRSNTPEFARRVRGPKHTPSGSPEKVAPSRRSSSRGPSPAKRRSDALAWELQEERMRHSAEVASLEMLLRAKSDASGRQMSDRELHDARYGQRLRDTVGAQSQSGGARKMHGGAGLASTRNTVQGPTGSHRLAAAMRDGGELPFPELSDTTDDDIPTPVHVTESQGRNGGEPGGKASKGANRWQHAFGKLKPRKGNSSTKEQQSP